MNAVGLQELQRAIRLYDDEALLAAVAFHANSRGLIMDPAYRTSCDAPAGLVADKAQFVVLVNELERRDVCGAGDLFTNSVAFEQTKKVHRAGLVDPSGNVSARCFRHPRAILLSQASWTIRDDLVTCKKCLEIARTYCPPSDDPDDTESEEYPIK